jgi:hypothetical protein
MAARHGRYMDKRFSPVGQRSGASSNGSSFARRRTCAESCRQGLPARSALRCSFRKPREQVFRRCSAHYLAMRRNTFSSSLAEMLSASSDRPHPNHCDQGPNSIASRLRAGRSTCAYTFLPSISSPLRTLPADSDATPPIRCQPATGAERTVLRRSTVSTSDTKQRFIQNSFQAAQWARRRLSRAARSAQANLAGVGRAAASRS